MASSSSTPSIVPDRTDPRIESAQAIDELDRENSNEDTEPDPKFREKYIDNKKKSNFRPNISQDDPDWVSKRDHFRNELRGGSVLDVVNNNLLEEHLLFLMPPPEDNEILKIQDENTELYNASLASDGQFSNQKNNLATKLTMLYFGFPIESITLNNIHNCDKDDVDDDPDPEEPPPRVQRIVYAEKPLEFLDKYNERSYGYPILRRPKPSNQLQLSDTENQNHGDNIATSMRGGASCPEELCSDFNMARDGVANSADALDSYSDLESGRATTRIRGGGEIASSAANRWIYSPNKKMTKVSYNGDSAEFLRQTALLLDFDPYTEEEWQFHVHIYNNGPENKHKMTKPLQRVIDVDDTNFFDVYQQSIERPLYNYKNDWLVVVAPADRKPAADQYSMVGHKVVSHNKPNQSADQTAQKTFDSLQKPLSQATAQTKKPGYNAPSGSTSVTSVQTGQRTHFSPQKTPRINSMHQIQSSSKEASTTVGNITGSAGKDTGLMHEIYGYQGMVKCKNAGDQIVEELFRMAGESIHNPGSSIYVFLPGMEDGRAAFPPEHISRKLDASSWRETWEKDLSQKLDPSEGSPRKVFAWSKRQNQPSVWKNKIQPLHEETNIIRLQTDDCTAYWKVARNLSVYHGINQLQPYFRGAMEFLFTHNNQGKRQLHGKVKIDGLSLGSTGLELTRELFDKVLNTQGTQRTWIVTYGPPVRELNLVGSHLIPVGSRDWTQMRDTLVQAVKQRCEGDISRMLPTSVKIWSSIDAREDNVGDSVIELTDKFKVTAAQSLRAIFAQEDIFCAPFQPNWSSWNIQTVAGDVTTKWDLTSQHPTLANFRNKVKEVLPSLLASTDFFVRENTDWSDENRIFRITKSTSEDEWRINVFNWLHSGVIQVDIASMPATFDTASTDFGAIPYVTSHDTAYSTKEMATNLVSSPKIQSTRTLVATHDNIAPPPSPLHPVIPEHNGARIIEPRAGRPYHQTWSEWTAEQGYKDSLHRQSYTKDQSVIMPGKDPVAPLYGVSRELQITGGGFTPTVYGQRLTTTDIRQIQDEKQSVRNQILERTLNCQICSKTFLGWENEKKDKHIQSHIDSLKSQGACPWCADSNWPFMTENQKRGHCMQHIASHESGRIKSFWASMRCPACDQDFTNWRTEEITMHCIDEHKPGILQFCPKCGVQIHELTNREVQHHKRACLDQRPLDKSVNAEPQSFCVNCGKDLNKQDETAKKLHDRDCQPVGGEWHCGVCGFDRTGLTQIEQSRHEKHHKPPGGWKGRFCQRCGQNLANMSPLELSSHKITCYKKVEPAQSSAAEQFEQIHHERQKLEKIRAENEALAQRNSKEKEDLDRRAQLIHGQNPTLETMNDRPNTVSGADENTTNKFLGQCPFAGCSESLGKKSWDVVASHLISHSQQRSSFTCPLLTKSSRVCGYEMNKSDSAAIIRHFDHKQQGTAAHGQSAAKGVNRQLREQLDNLTRENITSKQVLDASDNRAFPSDTRYISSTPNQQALHVPQQPDRFIATPRTTSTPSGRTPASTAQSSRPQKTLHHVTQIQTASRQHGQSQGRPAANPTQREDNNDTEETILEPGIPEDTPHTEMTQAQVIARKEKLQKQLKSVGKKAARKETNQKAAQIESDIKNLRPHSTGAAKSAATGTSHPLVATQPNTIRIPRHDGTVTVATVNTTAKSRAKSTKVLPNDETANAENIRVTKRPTGAVHPIPSMTSISKEKVEEEEEEEGEYLPKINTRKRNRNTIEHPTSALKAVTPKPAQKKQKVTRVETGGEKENSEEEVVTKRISKPAMTFAQASLSSGTPKRSRSKKTDTEEGSSSMKRR